MQKISPVHRSQFATELYSIQGKAEMSNTKPAAPGRIIVKQVMRFRIEE